MIPKLYHLSTTISIILVWLEEIISEKILLEDLILAVLIHQVNLEKLMEYAKVNSVRDLILYFFKFIQIYEPFFNISINTLIQFKVLHIKFIMFFLRF